jgi:CHAD domain-containing protein
MRHAPVLHASEALEHALGRAVSNQKRARTLDPEAIHKLRVALRRCRSLGEALSTVDSRPVWKRLRKACRKQQEGLSDLRDIQVMSGWVKRLRLTGGNAGAVLGKNFRKQERRAIRKAQASLTSFPRKRWKRWLRRLPDRVESISATEDRWAWLVIEKLDEVTGLHQQWREHANSETWHQLRVTAKRFRYLTESLLPELAHSWSRSMKRVQDLLGEGHDLDVLRDRIQQVARKKSLSKKLLHEWLNRIERAREQKTQGYLDLIYGSAKASAGVHDNQSDPHTLWNHWRAEIATPSRLNLPAVAEFSRSASSRGSRARARASQDPGRRHRISLVQ